MASFLLCVFWTAAVFANEVVEIFFAVIVREFFASFDGATSVDEYLISDDFDFAVWPTRVVEISRNIFPRFSVDRAAVVEIEKIFPAATIRFVVGDKITNVFDNEPAFANRFVRKDAKARCAAFYGEVECGFPWSLHIKKKILSQIH